MISSKFRDQRMGLMLAALVLSVSLSVSAVARLPVLGPTNWPKDSYKKAPGARGQRIFHSPEGAAAALIGAMRIHDGQKLSDILGAEGKKIVFPVNSAAELRTVCDRVVRAYHERNRIMKVGSSEAVLKIGTDERTFPVSIERFHGYWRFSGRRA